MSEKTLEKFFSQFPTVKFKAGDIFIRPGNKCVSLYVVTEGTVKIYSIDSNNVERRILSAQKYELIPSGWLVNPKIPAQYYYAGFTDVVCAVVSIEELNSKLKKEPDVLYELLKIQDHRVQFAKFRIESLIQSKAAYKLLHFFHYLSLRVSEPANSEGISKLKVALTQQEIGDALGITRETVAKTIAILEKQGLIIPHGYKSFDINVKKLLIELQK